MITDDFVEAIEDGRIVKVSERYAKQEGLMILRRQEKFEPDKSKDPGQINQYVAKEDPVRRRGREPLNLDRYRKPLDYKKNNIVADLKDNFHWEISKARKVRMLTRKQLADVLQTSEEAIKMIENGILPANDFVLVSKLEKYFGFNLRKSGMDYNKPALQQALGTEKKESAVSESESVNEDLPDIEVELDEE